MQNSFNHHKNFLNEAPTLDTATEQEVKQNGFDYFNFLHNIKNDSKMFLFENSLDYDIYNLQQMVLKTVSSEVTTNNINFLKDTKEFSEICTELNAIKGKFLEYFKMIKANEKNLKAQCSEFFEKELVQLYKSLEVIVKFEKNLHQSRDKLNLNKKKLFDLKKKIEYNEVLKSKQMRKKKIRKRWIFFGVILLLALYVLWTILTV